MLKARMLVKFSQQAIDLSLSYSRESGNAYLGAQGIEYTTDFDLWQNIMALLVFAAFFLVLTFIRLLTMNKLRWEQFSSTKKCQIVKQRMHNGLRKCLPILFAKT